MDNLNITRLDKVGPTGPKFSYKLTKEFGQSVYLQRRCKEKKVYVSYVNNSIRLYAKSKLETFEEIVRESLRYSSLPEPVQRKPIMEYCKEGVTICVITGNGMVAYVTEAHIEDMVEYIYKREIPHPYHTFVYNKRSEMVEELEKRENLII